MSFFQQLLAFATLAGLGGVVHYLTTLKTSKKFKWPSFFIELICSAFVDLWRSGIWECHPQVGLRAIFWTTGLQEYQMSILKRIRT